MDIDLVAAFPDASDGNMARHTPHKVACFVVDEHLKSLIIGTDGGPTFGDGGFGDLVVVDHDRAALVPFKALACRVGDKVTGAKDAIEQKAIVVVAEYSGCSVVGAAEDFLKASIILKKWEGIDAVVDDGLEWRSAVWDEKVECDGHGKSGFFVECCVEFGGDLVDLFEPILGWERVEKVSDLFDGDLRVLDHRVKRHNGTSAYDSLGLRGGEMCCWD